MLRTSNDPVQLMTAIQKGRLPVAKEVFQVIMISSESLEVTDLGHD